MRSFIFILLLLYPAIIFAQKASVYLFSDGDIKTYDKLFHNKMLSKSDSILCDESKLPDDPKVIKREMSERQKYYITGQRPDFLAVVFRNDADTIINVQDSKIDSVEIFFQSKDGQSQKIYGLKPTNEMLKGKYLEVDLTNVPDFPDGYSVNGVHVIFNGHDAMFYFRYLKFLTPYKPIAKNFFLGYWFPIGQFGSDLKKTPQGILFNALPLGIALGTKINITEKFYIGLSYSFNYTITKSNDSTSSYSFSSFSHGPIVDIDDIVQIGYNWFANLTTDDTKNRKPFFVVGIGVQLLDILKNKK